MPKSMAEVHAEGLHARHPRKRCPDCKAAAAATAAPPDCDPTAPPTGAEYLCVECGCKGPYHLFQQHARECMRGAPKPLPGESFDDWSARVRQWRSSKKNA